MPGVIGMGVTQRPEELVQSSTVKNVGNRIQPMCFIGQILKTSTEQFLFRNRRSNAIRKIIKISKFTKRTILNCKRCKKGVFLIVQLRRHYNHRHLPPYYYILPWQMNNTLIIKISCSKMP